MAGVGAFLEVGPDAVLAAIAQQSLLDSETGEGEPVVVASLRKDACRQIVTALPTVTTSGLGSLCTNRYLMSTDIR